MIEAEVLVESKNWKKIIQNPEQQIKKILKKLPTTYKFPNQKAFITVLLADNNKIKLLNKKFRKKNKPTDVLSFPYNDKVDKNRFYLGDIIISYNYMNQPKNISNLNFKNKVVKIFIHGFLHLLGFDHKKNSDFNKMQREENKLFNLLEKKIEKII